MPATQLNELLHAVALSDDSDQRSSTTERLEDIFEEMYPATYDPRERHVELVADGWVFATIPHVGLSDARCN
jgi:hypothetical protein